MRLLAVILLVLGATAGPAAAIKIQPPIASDFAADAARFYRIVACAGDDEVDAKLQKVVDAHCAWLEKRIATFREKFVEPAGEFFAKVRPAGLPVEVVYPFGGGDLISAMVTYPEATTITTLSLEKAGDPTRLAGITAKQLARYLKKLRVAVNGLLSHSVSETKKLRTLEKGPVPGQLSYFVIGAAILGYRPVHLRYFDLAADGTVVYYTDRDIAAASKKKRKLESGWAPVYANLELELEKVGDASAPVIIHRHLAADLSDDGFVKSPALKHLEAKGQVAVIVKSASYLLWQKSFAAVRTYLAGNLAWMASDSTGMLPKHATALGLEQTTYGRFSGVALNVSKAGSRAMIKLWKSQPHRKLAFRFGYRDKSAHGHVLITRPKGATP